jgi:CRP-like cAMP-binding protein
METIEQLPDCARCKAVARCLFNGMMVSDNKRFRAICRQGKLEKGALISMNGWPDRGPSVLCSGRGSLTFLVEDGREILLGFMEPGRILPGGLFKNRDVVSLYLKAATESAQILFVSGPDAARALDDQWMDPHKLQRAQLDLQDMYLEALRTLHFNKAEKRLCSALIRCARFFCENGHGVEGVSLPVTHQDLADMCGLMRNTVTLVLNRFREKGIVQLGRGRVVCRVDRIRGEMMG